MGQCGIRCGRYTFQIEEDSLSVKRICVLYDGKPFRNVVYRKDLDLFYNVLSKKMSISLLINLIDTFVTLESTKAKDDTHLKLFKACCYDNSMKYTTKNFGKSFSNPYGV